MKKVLFIFILALSRWSYAQNQADENIQIKPKYSVMEQTLIDLFLPYAKDRSYTNITINQDFDYTQYTGGVNTVNGEIRIIFGSEFDDVYKGLPEDAYAKILCHELGHILGGTAANEQPEGVKISPEGGSDYFAGAVCLKKLFKAYPPTAPIIAAPEVIMNCSLQYSDFSEQQICQRIAMAGYDFFKVFRASLMKSVPEIKHEKFYSVPDFKNKDLGFYDFYPSFQCRNEIVSAGAYCTTSQALWEKGEKNWHCASGLGSRPRCFLKVIEVIK